MGRMTGSALVSDSKKNDAPVEIHCGLHAGRKSDHKDCMGIQKII